MLRLSYMSNLVASGTKTSSGFKKVHLNACARALNEHFKLRLTGNQIGHHIRTWKRKYVKITVLKGLSAALWDEEKSMITLDHEHYTGHIKAHKNDAEYLNKPIDHYGEMVTIFGNSLATGKYAKGSSEPLGTEVTDEDGDANTGASPDGETSSASKPKRAKINGSEDDGLIAAFTAIGDRFATAMEKLATADKEELSEDLFDNLNNLPGFEETHKAFYYGHLVDNPYKARAFNNLPYAHKLIWVAKYISEIFPAQ